MDQDIWSQWLLQRRFSGDPQCMQSVLDYLYPVRDKVLTHARLAEGETLLDVGCGDGLIAFGALTSVETSQVIFSDISQYLLQQAQVAAQEFGMLDRCRFLLAPADDLSALDDASVDAVTTRSVLIYVSAKQQAFDEFYRVLRRRGVCRSSNRSTGSAILTSRTRSGDTMLAPWGKLHRRFGRSIKACSHLTQTRCWISMSAI